MPTGATQSHVPDGRAGRHARSRSSICATATTSSWWDRNWGRSRHPSWSENLFAESRAAVLCKSGHFDVHARAVRPGRDGAPVVHAPSFDAAVGGRPADRPPGVARVRARTRSSEGGHVSALLDACLYARIRVIDTRHEGAAALAAVGYALPTGSARMWVHGARTATEPGRTGGCGARSAASTPPGGERTTG